VGVASVVWPTGNFDEGNENMNLLYSPSPRPKESTAGGPLGGKRFTDPQVLPFVSAKITAATAAKDAAITALNAACAQAERDEVMLGSGDAQTGTIQALVLQITRLESILEYLGRAYTALGGV
jgi:hypothetical protein